jgi:hypothetical protein
VDEVGFAEQLAQQPADRLAGQAGLRGDVVDVCGPPTGLEAGDRVDDPAFGWDSS